MARKNTDTNMNKKLDELLIKVEKIDQVMTKVDDIWRSINNINTKLNKFEEQIIGIHECISGLKSSDAKMKNELKTISEKFSDRIVKMELLNTAKNLMIFVPMIKLSVDKEFRKITDVMEITKKLGQVMIFPIKGGNAENVKGMKIIFESIIDKQLTMKSLSKLDRSLHVTYQQELPPSLLALNNELLIKRRELLNSGTKSYIKTTFRPPFLILIDDKGKVLYSESE